VRAKVVVHEYGGEGMSVYQGKRKVGSYDREGRLKNKGRINKAKMDNPRAIKTDSSICY